MKSRSDFIKSSEIALASRLFLFILLVASVGTIQAASSKKEMNLDVKKELKWFTDARLGMFIHWTPLSVIDEEIGWSWGYRISPEKYKQLCKNWDPTRFDANEWVLLAKKAGMKYIVLVVKHHDGFCLWDTKQTAFNILNTPYGCDVCQQLSDACQKHKISFCTYYSIADLHENGWSKMCSVENKTFEPVRGGMEAYLEFMKKQCAELVQKYHTRNFWFDGFWHPEWYADAANRKQLYGYIKSLDANVIMARLQMPLAVAGEAWDDGWDFEKFLGDYHSREDHGDGTEENLYYKDPWEFCSSVAYPHYSFNSKMKFKTSKELIQTVVKIAGRNGNFLLNMAPKPDGSIDNIQKELFTDLGKWMKQNGGSVYGTEGGPYLPLKAEFACTRKGDKIFLHLMNKQNSFTLPAFPNRILKAQILGTKKKVEVKRMDRVFILSFPAHEAKEVDTIVELTIQGNAHLISLISLDISK